MAEPVAPAQEALLVRCFAEFDLLPDLLEYRLRHPDETEDAVVGAWGRLLDEIGYNDGHVEADEPIPDGMTLTDLMADDAYEFCRRIDLIADGGALVESGEIIARMGEAPYRERSTEDSRRMTRILAERIQLRFLGDDDTPLTDLLQRASVVLASHGWPWSPRLGGLLLTEVDTLLHWGALDWAAAETLAREDLVAIRLRQYEVMARAATDEEMADEGAWPFYLAKLIGDEHATDPGLARDSSSTTTGLRATGMALVFAQLTSLGGIVTGPQVLRPWDPPEDGH